MNFFKNLSFRRKLVLSYIIIIIFPITILGLYSYNESKTYLEEQVHRDIDSSTKQMINDINYRLKRYDDLIKITIYNPQVKKILAYKDAISLEEMQGLNDYVEPMLYNFLIGNRDIKKLTIFTEDGKPISGDFVQPNYTIKNTDWFNESSKNNKINWWFEKEELFATSKIFDISNSNMDIGMFYLKLDYKSVFGNLLEKHTYDSGFIISNQRKDIMFSGNTNNKINNSFDRKIINLQQGNVTIDGQKYIIVKGSIMNETMNIFYYVPVNTLVINSRGIIKATVTVELICLSLLCALVWLFSNTLVKRILKLNSKMQLVESGKYDIQVSSNSKDEIGQLYNSFGNMLKKTNYLIEEVYKSNITQKEAELKALQAQINPHFLYNTLSVINWKATMIGASDISHVIKTLSKFYRTTLNKGRSTISIKDEIENMQAYIEIQLVMHDNSFEVQYDFEEEIFSYDMINLVLQPIVENAIEHGIDHNKERKGVLTIKGRIKESCVEFTVKDNGCGMKTEIVEEVFIKHSKGYGLKNVQERILIFFGNEYGMTVNSEYGKGTSISVLIPKYNNPPYNE